MWEWGSERGGVGQRQSDLGPNAVGGGHRPVALSAGIGLCFGVALGWRLWLASAPMSSPPEIRKLVDRFEAHCDTYLSGNHNETSLRRDFLDPFFKALGWDIDNSLDCAEAFRDVIHEDAIRIGGTTKAPDYSFRVGGRRMFFVEAKKPSISIKDEIAPAYQLRRYAWSANLPVSILSDFEEFAVYDTRIKPIPTDKPTRARLQYFTYKDYIDRWDEIAAIFSKEAVLKGSFDRLTKETKGRHGTTTVDAEFLAQLESWRELLAKNIALRNPGIHADELNFAVQSTIDRIVFLRICEDRGIEPMCRLLGLTNGTAIYPRLAQHFREADARYNSGLFHFKREKGRHGSPDEFTLGLSIDDKLIREIITGLYYPASPYEFSVLPADILGQVYERFLGRIIRVTSGGHAKVEEKPEVKKAGGVYYTPTYIVEYIVAHTVGKSLAGCSPKEAAKLKILDPACGSGSFLLGAYQYLLHWHLKWYYENNPEKYAKGKDAKLYRSTEGWRLTAAERKRILINNIYGVDIDSQAVEVTKLSLLLKVLEGETDETISTQMKLFHERALPDLDGNIKCGNSLISPVMSTGCLALGEDEHKRMNAFDWGSEFPQVFQSDSAKKEKESVAGFDVIIGNPPYIRIQVMRETTPDEVALYKQNYLTAESGNYDIYVIFVERCLQLINKQGRIGYILPNKFFRTDYGKGVRRLLANAQVVSMMIDFEHSQVFDATTYTCLLFLEKERHDSFVYGNCEASPSALSEVSVDTFPMATLSERAWTLDSSNEQAILQKLERRTVRLLELPAEMNRGSSTGLDQVFVLDAETECDTLEAGILRTPLFASDFGRYRFNMPNKWKVIFPYTFEQGRANLIPESEIKESYPNVYEHLRRNLSALRARKQYRAWYGYSAPRSLDLHNRAQIAVPLLADRGLCTLIPNNWQGKLCPMASGGFTITLSEECRLKPEYVLGLLNSKLLFWRLRNMSNLFRGGWITCTKQYFGELPIRTIDWTDKDDVDCYERVIALVSRILNMQIDVDNARTTHAKERLFRQCSAANHEVDRCVYQLYGLSDDEIAIVETGTGMAATVQAGRGGRGGF